MLQLEHLAWRLPGGENILKGVDVHVPKGKLVVVTGPNGGGKTSLAKLVAGLETPTSGRILFDGEDITGLDITRRAQKGIAYAFQQPVRFKGLTVRDLLEMAAGKPLEECDGLRAGGQGWPVRQRVYRPRGGRQPFRRRGQAH